MGAGCRRRDIDDRFWDPIKGLLPGQRGRWGGAAVQIRCLTL